MFLLSRAPCPLCDGAGAIKCGEFATTAEDRPEALLKWCPECRGKGLVSRRRARLSPESCEPCQGTGYVERETPETRWQWQGLSRNLVVCPDCSGIGRRLPGPRRKRWFGWGRLELLAHLSYLLLLLVTIGILAYRLRWFR